MRAPGLEKTLWIPWGKKMTTIPRRVLVVSATEDRDTAISTLSHWAIDPVCCSDVGEASTLLPDVRPSLIAGCCASSANRLNRASS